MGEMKESVDQVMHMMEELSKHQPEIAMFSRLHGFDIERRISRYNKKNPLP
jgi:hypothetical protein